ncbi:hypothetical protein AUK11_02030 [bacterium CG2_30_37_16]|nr:MAG: hypothetical protein AUK11_02030 [bacterium CG2_30_37_16]PIP31062.1 MAG: hypothetical protein COX25_01550 [bacterium (Candidatus Howlettbacteria) CG23_combo_of_CG06-09_8_20_14_all_37_9]PIX99504.1 MAG: hypothetical protein COZ22_02420 [bacterium (Candidatus Howlettbacteria) CG_4_10_14_3_um_filter_37_10]PJB06945.1 MAG: hypothetical protein CO123_01145 [bacterium (Candidatus Howlettbacteria) CG_4_9_14_3_um_filter_37_10]
MSCGKWHLKDFDTFEEEYYGLKGSFETEELAIAGGKEKLKELEETQPSSQSGGQDPLGIQDKVFVVRPDGTDFRVF